MAAGIKRKLRKGMKYRAIFLQKTWTVSPARYCFGKKRLFNGVTQRKKGDRSKLSACP